MSDTEIADVPTHKQNGLDFIINVTGKNSNINGKTQEVKDYTTSKYARKETPLSQEELNYLQNNELPPLINYIYARPNTEQENAMVEMFEAIMNDDPYDVTRWGKYYKPNNIQFDGEGKFKLQGKVEDIKPAYTYETKTVVQNVEQEKPTQQVVEEREESPVRVNNLSDEQTETTNAKDAASLVADIMSKYNIQK